MTDNTEPVLVPVLTVGTPKSEQIPGQGEIVNGSTINIRKTHPALWRSLMVYAAVNVLLGLNFILLSPTFLIYSSSNDLWGAIFLALGVSKIVFANVHRSLRLVRVTMGCEIAFMVFIAFGATEPYWAGKGSLQNPILYIGLAILELPLLLEPFINPWTARRD